jgi:hypothetical protein
MSSNRILSRLAAADLALLEPHLQPVELSVHRALERRNRRIDHVYFIEVGFAASVVADGSRPWTQLIAGKFAWRRA